MILVVSEKPSVAQSIAKVLGATKRCEGYLEGPCRSSGPASRADRSGAETGYLVSWCIGHLVEPSEPESYDETYGKWRMEDLPIVPEHWKYQVSPGTKKQFQVLKQLMNRNDVERICCATDAGREGELIFRLVYHQCGCKKPFDRLWISSMEDPAIREGFRNLKSGSDYDKLYQAALCRERADWIVGINATRLFSYLYGQTLNVGRVMTPTLSMVVMRDAAIAAFKPETFYTVQLQAGFATASSKRFKSREEADALAERCRAPGTRVTVTKVEKKEKAEKAPALYDLTSLQRDANRQLGFTAQQTLDYTQSLYEKKLVTYPRTDSRYLTDDMEPKVGGLSAMAAGVMGIHGYQADSVSQAINSKKVSDHHAIIPTEQIESTDLTELPSEEQAVLRLVMGRLLTALGVPYRYEETGVEITCADTVFTAKGRCVLDDGWKDVVGQIAPKKDSEKTKSENTQDVSFPNLREGATLPVISATVKEGQTSVPKYFTEDTLLNAMEHAGSEEMPEEAERKGIGTPATRAGIIEKLVQKGFIERRDDKKKKHLCATAKGTALITVMPEQIQSPSMTAEWEEKLLMIERGQYAPDVFMAEITDMVRGLVETYEVVRDAEVLPPSRTVVGTCPHCGKEVIERKKGWFCSNRDCRFALWKENAFFASIGKKMTEDIAQKLLSDGKVHLAGCKSKKSGKTYDTTLVMETAEDSRPEFRMEFGGNKNGNRSNRKNGGHK